MSCNSEPNFTLFVLALQIVPVTLYNVIHYNDVIFALGSYVFRRNMFYCCINFEKFFSITHRLVKLFNAPRSNQMHSAYVTVHCIVTKNVNVTQMQIRQASQHF